MFRNVSVGWEMLAGVVCGGGGGDDDGDGDAKDERETRG
jgi:hypothetical protein